MGSDPRRASGARRAGSAGQLRLRLALLATAPVRSLDRDDTRPRRHRRVLDRGARGGLPRARRPGVPRDVAAHSLPEARRTVASRGLDATHRHHLVPARRVRHPADAEERRARAGVVECRDALPDHARGHRDGASLPSVRAERRGRRLGASRLQCRRQAHADAHECRRRIHGHCADATHRPLPRGARAARGDRRRARTGRPCGAARRDHARSSAGGRERPRAPLARPRESARRNRSAG